VVILSSVVDEKFCKTPAVTDFSLMEIFPKPTGVITSATAITGVISTSTGMYVCMYVCLYEYIYIYIYMYIFTNFSLMEIFPKPTGVITSATAIMGVISTSTGKYIFINMCELYIYIHICICIHICIYKCIYKCIYTYMYIYMEIFPKPTGVKTSATATDIYIYG
jgi:hypothetical protein